MAGRDPATSFCALEPQDECLSGWQWCMLFDAFSDGLVVQRIRRNVIMSIRKIWKAEGFLTLCYGEADTGKFGSSVEE